MKRKCSYLLTPILFLLTFTYASMSYATDVNQVVSNILGPLSGFTDAFFKICYAMGTLLILGAGVQYSMHRKNPVQVRLSNVIFLLIVGIVVICLPILAHLSSSAETINKALQKQQQQTIVPKPAKPVQRPGQSNDWYNNPSSR